MTTTTDKDLKRLEDLIISGQKIIEHRFNNIHYTAKMWQSIILLFNNSQFELEKSTIFWGL
jgi:hypothetical protein